MNTLLDQKTQAERYAVSTFRMQYRDQVRHFAEEVAPRLISEDQRDCFLSEVTADEPGQLLLLVNAEGIETDEVRRELSVDIDSSSLTFAITVFVYEDRLENRFNRYAVRYVLGPFSLLDAPRDITEDLRVAWIYANSIGRNDLRLYR